MDFLQGMRDLDYVVGKNFEMEWRFAEGRYDLFPDLAAELVRLKVDVIVLGSPTAIDPVRRVTSTIPIVMGYFDRSGRQWLRCKPCTSGWKYHRAGKLG